MEKGGAFSDWESFLQALQTRFGTSIYDNPLGHISKLTQTGRVSDYRTKFESLMPRISGVDQSMFLNFFVWGLKLEIRRELLMLKPVDLADAMAKAQLFEDRHDDLSSRNRFEVGRPIWSSRSTNVTPATNTFSQPMHKQTTSPAAAITKSSLPSTQSIPIKRLSPAKLKDRRDKGLCFTCDEKFSYGHKCKNQMLILCGYEEEDCDSFHETGFQATDDITEDVVSLNSLSNSMNPGIFWIMAKHGAETLEVLIDTGNNNNFIQESLANHLQLSWEETKRFKGVELVLQGHRFIVDLYVFPICGLDVVLRMQWLQTLGPCIHDHKALTMEFSWKGSVVKLAGSTDVSTHQLSYTQFNALLREGEGKGILTQYAGVFDEPKRLPPYRAVDHIIFLQPGSIPVNVRPYRYPYFQKDVIEKLVKEMMEMGFIRSSTSPYSSPVLLVKKKDESWRFCVDYRAINGITVKDRLPIPTIEELLDELGNAKVFSKLDLRAGYHQIRYYRRFVVHYATIAAPLTELLKQDNFNWSKDAAAAFEKLKIAMTHTPVLRLPDFSKEFIIETYASNVGIGGVLMQEGNPLDYFSKKLDPRFVGASAYIREMRAIVEAVSKWRQYFLGRHFIIRTDHKSLRELLTQVIQTLEQQHFI
ncbi:uncharacterized protein LOC133815460 [Humulus lupulus]|uniref:uncharacterized protein LOC133815460 n=1 Tax=Humulus lupulus TaxID=3486 RepID=UPI002B414269|nr:uncharacterized protein LOC133815460 [Humulus lupulus]